MEDISKKLFLGTSSAILFLIVGPSFFLIYLLLSIFGYHKIENILDKIVYEEKTLNYYNKEISFISLRLHILEMFYAVLFNDKKAVHYRIVNEKLNQCTIYFKKRKSIDYSFLNEFLDNYKNKKIECPIRRSFMWQRINKN